MALVLVGHRGAGKTSYLARCAAQDPSREAFDLDAEVARDAGLTVDQIFTTEGEASFRARETRVLTQLLARPGPKIIALGAGYVGPRPSATIIWVRRDGDRYGRIFLNRPRLDATVAPLEEYRARFAEREQRYAAWADFVLTLPEGYDGGLEDFVNGNIHIPFDLTVPAGRDPVAFRARRKPWGVRRFEIRDDLTETLPPVRGDWLISHRRAGRKIVGPGPEDWALELGPPPAPVAIVSVHAGDVEGGIAALATHRGLQKLAVEIKTFGELMRGHRWWTESPKDRAFLPRSPNGRWAWYRTLFGPRMPLHFVREDNGLAPDQPSLAQTVLQPRFEQHFAAVLGAPVALSRTPIEHRRYFGARQRPVVAVEVHEEEWDEALPILESLGLTHAAVTAPLKLRAFRACTRLTDDARATGAVNTLHLADGERFGTNTDLIALRTWAAEHSGFKRPWLWGGGGVKSSVRLAWPGVREISARSGPGENSGEPPDLLIWAVGRARHPPPPPPWVRPRLVLDLNYADDSPGLEFATDRQIAYQSGLAMFKTQAEAQRRFWDEIDGSVTGAR